MLNIHYLMKKLFRGNPIEFPRNKKILKNFKKSIDKSIKVCYNKYVR